MSDWSKNYQSRLKFVVFGLFGLFGLVMIRLIDLQIWQSQTFVKLSQSNREYTRKLALVRGVITDRYDQPAAVNYVQYYYVNDPQRLFNNPVRLDYPQALELLASQSGQVITKNTRFYPFADSLSQAVGYVQLPTKDDLLNQRGLAVDEVVGKAGLELKLENELRGISGSQTLLINALGKIQKQVELKPSTPGQSFQTTLDPFLSQVALRAMGDKKGAVVILDGKTGGVLTMVSTPSFNPNAMTKPSLNNQQQAEWQNQLTQLLTNPNQPFFNRAMSGIYPPGSVFKPMTALAVLESGKFDSKTTIKDTGTLQVGGYSYNNWYFTQYGRVEGELNLRKAIARSNDIFFYKAAESVGPEPLAKFARKFGFGQNTGIELKGESLGLVPDPEWKLAQNGEPWYLGNTYHFGIGQGDLLVTPLQIARMTQTIANQGVICPIHLLESNNEPCQSLDVKVENLQILLGGMLDACSQGGTAFPFFSHNQQYRRSDLDSYDELPSGAVACKTGTAEWGGVDERGYRQTHAWFTMAMGLSSASTATVGGRLKSTTDFTDFSDWSDQDLYQAWQEKTAEQHNLPSSIVITILVESDSAQPYAEGSVDAAPVARRIVDWILNNE